MVVFGLPVVVSRADFEPADLTAEKAMAKGERLLLLEAPDSKLEKAARWARVCALDAKDTDAEEPKETQPLVLPATTMEAVVAVVAMLSLQKVLYLSLSPTVV